MIENFDNSGITPENFAQKLKIAIGEKPDNKNSEYKDGNGDVCTLRFSDHRGNTRNVVLRGIKAKKGYSFVVLIDGSSDRPYKNSDWADVTELVYNNADASKLKHQTCATP